MSKKVLRDVPGCLGYRVSEDGELWGRAGGIMKQATSRDGYKYVTLRLEGNKKPSFKLRIHRAVLLAFVGPPGPGEEARHLDGNPANNQVSNLAWGDRFQQREDDRRNGVFRGRPNKLNEAKASKIKSLRGQQSSREVGHEFGVSHTTVLKIWRGQFWARVE